MKKGLVFTFILLFSGATAAEIYRWVDEQGTVHYTDQPKEGAKAVVPPDVNTYTPQVIQKPKTADTKQGPEQKKPAVGYQQLTIQSPKMDETIRSNALEVTITLALEPGLIDEDSLSVILNGEKALSGITSSQIALPIGAPGTHTLQAVVKNPEGKTVIESKQVTFYLRRAGAQKKKEQPSPSPGTAANSSLFSPDYQNATQQADGYVDSTAQ